VKSTTSVVLAILELVPDHQFKIAWGLLRNKRDPLVVLVMMLKGSSITIDWKSEVIPWPNIVQYGAWVEEGSRRAEGVMERIRLLKSSRYSLNSTGRGKGSQGWSVLHFFTKLLACRCMNPEHTPGSTRYLVKI
jgi:hypothetical protein